MSAVNCEQPESRSEGDVICDAFSVGGVYIARVQYSSSGEGAAGLSLGAVHMEEGVQVRVQVEVGREEVGDREKH